MQKLINDNWQFAKLPLGSALSDALALPANAWRDVDIPHDWLIENADDLYQSGAGWYRRALDVPAAGGAVPLLRCQRCLSGAG